MSKFYGTVEGNGSSLATKCGTNFIKTSAQSYDGSVITKLYYDDQGELCVRVGIANGSGTVYEDCEFHGKFKEFIKLIEYGRDHKKDL